MPKKTFYKELDDVIFLPKKKSLLRKVLTLLTILLLLGGVTTAFLYSQGYLTEDNSLYLGSSGVSEIESSDRFKTVKTFVRKPCGLQEPGEEHYTDWFEIRSDLWKISLTSERIVENQLANVRVWYTQSSEPILEGGIYTEAGEGGPNYDTGNKNWDINISGSGLYRLRILCWNTNYTIEVQESNL